MLLRRTLILSASIVTLLGSTALLAAPESRHIESITYPATITLEEQTLPLNGAGLRKKLFFKVYAAGLYLSPSTHNALEALENQGPRRVRLGLLRDVSGSSFIGALEDGLNDNLTPEKKNAIEAQLTALKTLMRTIGDVKTGDIVDFDYTPQTGTVVKLNDKPVGDAIAGKALYDAVLAIWLGDKAIDNTLKRALLDQ